MSVCPGQTPMRKIVWAVPVCSKGRSSSRPGVSAAWRVLYGSRVFRILSVIDWEERHESLLLMVQEVET